MFRFMTQRLHAYIDYPVALGLIIAPFVLGIGMGPSSAWAFAISVIVGLSALVLTALTDHETGVLPVIPYTLHLLADGAVGVGFLAAPFLLNFAGLDALYYWVLGAAILLVVAADRSATSQMQPAE